MSNNKEHKYNFGSDKINEYTLILNNDLNYTLVPDGDIGYCLKCFRKIKSGSFCDDGCKREYYAEIRRDQNGFLD